MENLTKYIKWKNQQFLDSDKTFKSLFDIIHDQGDRIFCEYFEMFQPQIVSYKQFKEICYKTASYFSNKLISPKNSFVGIYMENSINWIATFWALLMLGYRPVLLNCKLPSVLNNDVIRLTNCKEVILSTNDPKPSINSIFYSYPEKEIINSCSLYEPKEWGDEIAICTTASSMNLKICVYKGRGMTNQLMNAKYIIDHCPRIKKHYKQRLKLLAFLPFYHIFGLVATYLWFCSFGRTIVLLNDYSSDTILNTINFFEVTHIFSVPLFWNSIARAITNEIDRQPEKLKKKFIKAQNTSIKLQRAFPHLGLAIAKRMFKPIIKRTLGNSVLFNITGGGNILETTLKLLNSIGYPLANGYGSSEMGILLVNMDFNIDMRMSSSAGAPLSTYELKIEDNKLFVKGTSSASYLILSNGEKVDIVDTWFDTQDEANEINGTYFINGRIDDVFVNENGEKINPDLIERKLELTSLTNYCITQYNNKLSLIVQISKSLTKYDIQKTIKDIEDNVNKLFNDGYAIQTIYYTYDPLAPENAIKVSRKILAEWLKEGKVHLHNLANLKAIENQSDEQVDHEIVNRVKNIIALILNKNPNDVKNNQHIIFDLGASSLEYMTCLIRLQNEFGVTFDFTNNSCKTIDEFSQYIINYKKGVKYDL